MEMFTRARLQLPLAPSQRAFLKVLKGLVISAIMTAATAVWPLIQSQNVNWRTVVITAITTVAFTLFTALDKYWTSQGDAPLAAVAGSVAAAIPSPTPTSAPQPASNI
jgi:hypothetical protein